MAATESAGLVPPVDLETATAIATAAGLRPEMANIIFYRILVHSPQAARVENEINDRILWEGRLTVRPEANRLRELAIMRIAWVTGSAYMWAHHYSPTVDRDLPGHRPTDVLWVREGVDHTEFGPAERAVMRAVDEMVEERRVSRETFLELRSHLADERELVELVYVIAIWNAISKLMATFEVPLEPAYQEWAPDGRGPDDKV